MGQCGGWHGWLMVGVLGFSCGVVGAQERVEAKRADGHATPLMVYRAAKLSNGKAVCAPLAVISHGAGGSENGYRYLAEAMASLGYTAVVMGHAESGMSAMAAEMREEGMGKGVKALVADPGAENARLLDVGAALQWSDTQCRAPFRVLLGHSMGSATVMFEAGAKPAIAVPNAGKNRFDAYVALSPQGPGLIYPDGAWKGIHKPMLILTGTKDEGIHGGPEARLVPFRELPGAKGQCQWQGVIDGATHMNFAGLGLGARGVEQQVTATIASFLRGVRAGGCSLPDAEGGIHLTAK
jgi:predicted dienelactone hydrolase